MCQLFQACRLCFNMTGIRFRSAFPWFESYQAASASLYDQVWMTGWRFTSSMPAIMRSLSSCFEVTRMWRRGSAFELARLTPHVEKNLTDEVFRNLLVPHEPEPETE